MKLKNLIKVKELTSELNKFNPEAQIIIDNRYDDTSLELNLDAYDRFGVEVQDNNKDDENFVFITIKKEL